LTIVIKKGRGNRPNEALATLLPFIKEGAKFYPIWIDNLHRIIPVILGFSHNNNF
jgi:hypothetical protein